MTEWSTPWTRARSSGRAGRHRAFSLLELLIVLVIAALIAGLAGPAIGRTLARDAERRQVVELVNHLRAVRLEAITAMTPRAAVLSWSGGELRSEVLAPAPAEGDPPAPWTREWEGWRLEPMWSRDVQVLVETEVTFDPEGRTSAGPLWFRGADTSDRLWSVRFDPVSGAPSAQLTRDDPGARVTP